MDGVKVGDKVRCMFPGDVFACLSIVASLYVWSV